MPPEKVLLSERDLTLKGADALPLYLSRMLFNVGQLRALGDLLENARIRLLREAELPHQPEAHQQKE